MKPSHTPTPWALNEPIKTEIVSGYGSTDIGVAQNLREADAAFIVRAVNSHEELVKALKDVLFVLKGQAEHGNFLDSSERDISLEGVVEQAIAKAEGE